LTKPEYKLEEEKEEVAEDKVTYLDAEKHQKRPESTCGHWTFGTILL
jgi:hypothetical protein